MEGIVFHHTANNRMCKIRKSDFGVCIKVIKNVSFKIKTGFDNSFYRNFFHVKCKVKVTDNQSVYLSF